MLRSKQKPTRAADKMDTEMEFLFDLADNELQKRIIREILERGVNEKSITELISYIEKGAE